MKGGVKVGEDEVEVQGAGADGAKQPPALRQFSRAKHKANWAD